MSDPRLNGSHLPVARHDRYDAAVEEMLDHRGPATSDADPLARLPAVPRAPIRREAPPPGGTYSLINLADGRRHTLRIGINAIGRYAENDLVLTPNEVSRRYCTIVVHATGSCEVYDTASRNGTRVNRHRVAQADLMPGDVLALCYEEFVLEWVGPDGQRFPVRAEKRDTLWNSISPTG